MELFHRALAVRDNAATRLNLGNALARTDPAGAVEHLQRAAVLAPRLAEVWRRLGELLSVAGRQQEAEAALRRSLALETSAAALLAVGRLCLATNRLAQALQVAGQLASLVPGVPEPLFIQGMALLGLGRGAEAVAALDGYVRMAAGVPAEAQRVSTAREVLARRSSAAAAKAP